MDDIRESIKTQLLGNIQEAVLAEDRKIEVQIFRDFMAALAMENDIKRV